MEQLTFFEQRSLMAKSTEQRLEEALATAAEIAYELTDGKVRTLAIDFQDSGSLPFRLTVPDETLPLVGVATVPPRTEDKSGPTTGVAEALGGGQ